MFMLNALEPTADVLPFPAETRRDARLRRLARLGDIGLEMAEKLNRQADLSALYAEIDPVPMDQRMGYAKRLDEIAGSFAKVSRAVSVAAALEDRIERGVEASPEAVPAYRHVSADPAASRKRAQAAEALEVIISADETARHPRRRLDLTIDLDRLLAAETRDIDRFLERPLGEIVARISKDLGLEPDWSSWDADWATEAEQAPRFPTPPPLSPVRKVVAKARSVPPNVVIPSAFEAVQEMRGTRSEPPPPQSYAKDAKSAKVAKRSGVWRGAP